ncbi:MAG: hypothetical protein JO048_00195 [Methylobacteriaceae bacterium]|nr:hypothetical protein [Methylobacteriaceae bacterium]
MRPVLEVIRSVALAGAAAGLTLPLWAAPSQAQSKGAFAEYAGAWSGSGRVESASGTESIRCRAQGQVGEGGTSVTQRLVCASASYQFNIDCRATDKSGQVSGSWNETTRGISGSLSGTVGSGRLQAVVNSPLFTANVSIVSRGKTQEVVIAPQNNDVRQVSVRLTRS